jgi:ribose 5-phosphate isomerase RpiB
MSEPRSIGLGPNLPHELAGAFVRARFMGEERHARRLAKIEALETRYR